ncbi:beta-N-acetylhexosaminidase, partial [Pseudomonas sp. HMWF031]
MIRKTTNIVKACLSLSLLLVGSASAMAETPSLQQASLNALGESLDVHYEVLSNVDDSLCRVHIPKGDCFSSELTIATMAIPIEASTSLYFSHIAPIRGYDSKNAVRIEHINGDLHRLTFEEKVNASDQIKVTLSAPFWHASRSDAMPNYYLTYPALSPVVVASTTRVKESGSNLLINQHTGLWNKHAQYKRTENDNTPLMDSAYLYNKGDSALISDDVQNRVIPNVSRRDDSDKFVAAAGINIDKSDQDMLAPAIEQMAYFGLTNQKTGLPFKVIIRSAHDANALANEPATTSAKEGYALSIT